jgi:ABC-2 type transport system permease protein
VVRSAGPTSLADLGVYRRLTGARVRGELQYRTSFAMFALSQGLISLIDAVGILILFANVDAIGDWSVTDVMFLYGTSTLAFALADLFVSPVADVAIHIRQGSFDRYYLRPAGLLVQLLADEFALRRIGKLVQAVVVLTVVLALGAMPWTVDRIVFLPISLAGAFVIFSALFVLTSTLSFWSPASQEVGNVFTYGGVTAANYPLHIFGEWLQRAAIYVIPLAATAYLPGLYLTGAANPLHIPAAAQLASPLLAIPAVLAAWWAWRTATRHYRSTGS